MPPTDLQTLLAMFLRDLYAGTVTFTGSSLGGNGTALLPAYSFTSEPTLGFWRSSAGVVTLQGSLTSTGILQAGTYLRAGAGGSRITSPTDGTLTIMNAATTIGAAFKVDALPTVGSGFGTSPAVTAGSTPLAGSVNVGTGGVATTGVITFGGTAFPVAPVPIVMNQTTGAVVRATASTTQLTITAPAAFTASDVISWICIGSK